MADEKPDLEKVALAKRSDARAWKAKFELDFREMYFLSAPQRQRQISSQSQPAAQPMMDAQELQTSEGFLLCEDFTTEVVNGFMPESLPWCERDAGMDLPDGVWENAQIKTKDGQMVKLKDQAKSDDDKIFKAIKASNFYSEVTKAFNPDLAIGTFGFWIRRPHPSRPISVLAVPLRELEINMGPNGEIDDRFAIRYARNAHVRELIGEEIWAKMGAEEKKKIEDKPSDRTEVSWGYWRIWDRFDDEVWQHVVLVSDKIVHDVELKGEGSCPLIVGRFNPSADWPFGIGPLYKGLPDLRQIDELEARKIEAVSRSINPPVTFPDDSFTNVEQGIEDGFAYAVRPGSAADVKPIYPDVKVEEGLMQLTEMVKRLRKLFFVDYPEQTGDTPPTLGQWLDEMARAQRRIGTPGLPFWREGPAKIFLRFKFLLEASGAIVPLMVDGKAIATMPRNPAQAAAEQQELATAIKYLQLFGPLFPEGFKINIDDRDTIEAILAKARVTLITMRKPDQVKQMLAQFAQLAQNKPPQGEPSGGAPAAPAP